MSYKIQIRSRHPTHNPLRKEGVLKKLPFRSVVRFGSLTEYKDNRVELNSVDSVKTSSNKYLMKLSFHSKNVKTADWWTYDKVNNKFIFADNEAACNIEDLPYPIISKSFFGSRNKGNTKHDNKISLEAWMKNKNLSNYIFEKFYNYNREYRIHVTKNGYFYSCRKLLKNDIPKEKRWYRNDDNSIWAIEENPLFDKPNNWDNVVEESVKALEAVGLDIGAVDLRIQSNKKTKDPDFIIVEINSAPSFGDITLKKYIEEIPKTLISKYEK